MLKLTTDKHEASRSLSVTAELLVKTVILPLRRGRFVVVHLYSGFLWTPGFTKNYYFSRFWGL